MSQRNLSVKSSVTISLPRPGRISGVGTLVDKTISVGVADGGNQFMVAVGSGVSVGTSGVGVARISSSCAQEVRNVIASNVVAKYKSTFRNDMTVEKIIGIL